MGGQREPELAELHVVSIAAGGDGVARHDGVVVFTPRTAPGDIALVRATVKRRFARGELVSVVTPSPQRVEPPCEHYTRDRCGGCHLQHMNYDAQLAAKQGIVRDALQRIGHREAALPTIRPSAAPWRYRRKLTLALRRREGAWIAGLHPYDRPGDVFDLRDCPITDERVLDVWRDVMRASALLPEANALRGAVRLLDERASFVLEGGAAWPSSQRFFDAAPSLAAIWWVPAPGRRRLLHDRREHRAADASFAQVNSTVAAELHAWVLARVLAHAPATAVDAYAGAGGLALALAGAGVRVVAIELDRDAARHGADRLPEGSRMVAARVEDALADALPADVVILNPPRAGVDERVSSLLASAQPRPRAVIYVSCDPATLARDLARLPGWRLSTVTAFDMFPQTAHVETVCELVPEDA